jgi:hypothetical protein
MLPRKPDVPAGATLGVPRATSSSSNGCGGRLGNLRLRAHAAGSLIQKVPLCVVFESRAKDRMNRKSHPYYKYIV